MKRYKIKINLFSILLGISCLLGCLACDKEDKAEISALKINTDTELFFNENGGTQSLDLSSNCEWTVETLADWCKISPASGNGNMVCEIAVDSSYLYDNREAELVFSYGAQTQSIKVSQLGYKKQIKLSTDMLNVDYFKPTAEAYQDLQVMSNVKFKIEISDEDAEWLSYEMIATEVHPTPRPSSVRIYYKLNPKVEVRTGKVTFLAEDDSVEPVILTINQGAAPKISPSRAGDSLAILAISRTLDCYNSWDPNRPMIYWEDVVLEEMEYLNENNEWVTEERVTGVEFFMFDTNESLPFEIQYLTELRTLVFQGNSNAFMKSIHLGHEVTLLPKLKSLSIAGYGLVSLPKELKNMAALEELVLAGNNFQELPIEVLISIPNIKMISFSNNRRNELLDLSQKGDIEYGLGGRLTTELFDALPDLEYLRLSYNYFEGTLPELPVGSMPNLNYLSLNLNRFTGELPEWILKHPNLACWYPDFLIFEQEGRDSNGKKAGFTNVPLFLENPDCPLWEVFPDDSRKNKSVEGAKLSLRGNWRYNQPLN